MANSLDIFQHYIGWAYRFHGDMLTYTQKGFTSPEAAFEAAQENKRVQRAPKPIRVSMPEDVAPRLGIVGEMVRSMTGGSLVVAKVWL